MRAPTKPGVANRRVFASWIPSTAGSPAGMLRCPLSQQDNDRKRGWSQGPFDVLDIRGRIRWSGHGTSQGDFTAEAVRWVREAVFLEKEVGKGLGSGQVL